MIGSTRITLWIPDALREAANQAALSESVERGHHISASEWIRDAMLKKLSGAGEVERDAIEEILFGAWCYDDKPHRLYNRIIALADKYETDPAHRREIRRLMGIEVYGSEAEIPDYILAQDQDT